MWFYTICTALVLLFLLVQSIRLLRSRGRVFARDFTLALRSGVIFLLLMVPLTHPEQIAGVAINLQAVYVWLPLWYMSTLRKSLGGWIQIAVHALQGTVAAVLVILALNAMKAIERTHGESSFQWKWLAIVFVLAYGIGWSKVDKDLKKFFFGTLSPLLVMCLGADSDSHDSGAGFFKAQETALIYQEHINWTSIIFCYLYLTLVALSLSAITLLGRAWLASNEVAEDVAVMALETWRSLKLLLNYFSCRPADFDLDALGQHLQMLKTASLHLENQPREAMWETCCWKQHRRLHGLLQLLTSVQAVLLAALSWLRGHPGQAPQDLSVFLQEFESASGSALRGLTAPWWLHQNKEDRDAAVIDGLEHAELADGALMACLEQLRDPGRPESTTPASVMQPAAAFVETLREIPKAMKDFLLNKVGDDFQPSIEAEWALEQPWLANRHRRALGYAVAWVASLLWCIRFRGGSSALCSILVAWQLPFTWVTLHGTLNEFLGTVGGVILGALPSFLLRLSPAMRSAQASPGAHELFLCFSLMYILWTTATYYAQVQAFQWRVAALFWSCFGGVEMLRDFGLAEDLRSNIWKQQSWNSLVDFSIGCGLVFFCELVLGALCREAPSKSRAAQATAASLESCAKMVSSLQDGDGYLMRGQASELLTRVAQQQQQTQKLRQRLAKDIMEARFWNAEALHCLRFWDLPWRGDMVSRILDQCDAILLASRTIAWSSERFGGPGPSALLLKALIPPQLPQRLHHCSEVCFAALQRQSTEETWSMEAQALLSSPSTLSGDTQQLAAAAAQMAIRGAVHVMLDALMSIQAALVAQETLSLPAWTKLSSSKQVNERGSFFAGSEMA